MDIAEQISRVHDEGEALAHAAFAGPLDSAIPGCPDWDVEALVRHIGRVHRWAGRIVRERLHESPARERAEPARSELEPWYREGHAALLDALTNTSAGDDFWFWGPAPNALAFWARRQANETAIHRRDAEAARGPVTPLRTRDALDGIDEWLGLAALRTSAPAGRGRILRIATDEGAAWRVVVGDHLDVTGDTGDADCEIRGPASDLFLWSMNRRGADDLTVNGDASLLRVWSESVRF
jgi:uncharacterized protein (TIGR03083 family)